MVIQKFIVMSGKYVSWHGIKTDILRVSYSIFIILIPKSVLVFFTFASTSFDDTDFARLYLVRNLPTSILVGASVSLLALHTSTILAPFWFTNFRISSAAEEIPETFHFHAYSTFPYSTHNLSISMISLLSNEAVEHHRRLSVAV